MHRLYELDLDLCLKCNRIGASRFDRAGPAHDHRHAEAAFPGRALLAVERGDAAIGPGDLLGAVVGAVDDDRVVGDAVFVEQVEQPAGVVDHTAGLALPGVAGDETFEAGDLEMLLDVDGQREEVEVLLGRLRCCRRREHHGVVVEGHSAIDASMVTGEPVPADVAVGDEVIVRDDVAPLIPDDPGAVAGGLPGAIVGAA